ncbi:hypothetical protein [Streptomyces hydrogenans]|uniref:hypothetical protein n=1 Tax=Streptomyces hydrogenans TaxID=1873719 RepID=UPI00381A7F35
MDVASSGQATPAALAADPHAWGVGALPAVLLFKPAAYALSLGSLRSGLVFPVLFPGAVAGVLLSLLPASGWSPRSPRGRPWRRPPPCGFRSAAWPLVVLVLGNAETIPVVILAVVTSFVIAESLSRGPSGTKRRPPGEVRAAG